MRPQQSDITPNVTLYNQLFGIEPVTDLEVPGHGARQNLKRKLSRGGRGQSVPAAFGGVPRKEILVAAGRVVMSQTPFHKPEHEPLPQFAGQWFERWDGGGDVTDWYGAARTS
jgi:hypothetical protein